MRNVLLMSLVLLHPTLCFAWGGEGHQLVALIAENELTPQAKSLVNQLLDGANISDAEVASWADEIRRDQRDTAPWHYVNIPVTAAIFDHDRDGRNSNNVIDAIEAQSLSLADKSQPKERRAEALKWVVHLVGDAHQPLHCAERDNDKGGNAVKVLFLDRTKPISLHQVWDTWILREMIGKRKIADVSDGLAKAITPKQRKEWSAGNPEQWVNETHRIAVDIVYAAIPTAGPPPKLTREYVERMTPIVTEQIKRAGVRIAMTLNATAK